MEVTTKIICMEDITMDFLMSVLAKIWDFVFAILDGAGVEGLENFKNPFIAE